MKVSKDEIRHIANLASLNLTETEVEKYANNMDNILNFAETINGIDTNSVDETITAISEYNVFRKDEINEFEDNDALLANAPSKEDNMFIIPKVID